MESVLLALRCDWPMDGMPSVTAVPEWVWWLVLWAAIVAVILMFNHGAHKDDADDDSH